MLSARCVLAGPDSALRCATRLLPAVQADVLTLGIASDKFVLNKQGPNKQLWLSSPVRGPLRYDFCTRTANWLNTRDGHEMLPAISDDVEQLTGHRLCFEGLTERLRETTLAQQGLPDSG